MANEPINQIPIDNTEPLLETLVADQSQKMEDNNGLLETTVEQNADRQAVQEAQLGVQNDIREKVRNLRPSFTDLLIENFVNSLAETLKGEKGDQGIQGEKPVKGVDYFTPQELEEIYGIIQSRVKVPEDGKTPQKFVDYFTKEEVKEIVDYVIKTVNKGVVNGKDGKDGRDGTDAVIDYDKVVKSALKKIKLPKEMTGEEIAKKLKNKISYNDLTDLPNVEKFRRILGGGGMFPEIFTNPSLSGTGLADDPLKIEEIFHDATLTGKGTSEDPLKVDSPAFTDEKVKYDASDPTAGYLSDKIKAGLGIIIAEGTGADENKVVVTNTYSSANPTLYSSSVDSKGGVIRNIDNATGDIAQTSFGWIESRIYKFWAREVSTSTSAEFDSAVTRTGRLTMKLSTLDASGTGQIKMFPHINPPTFTFFDKYGIDIKPSTTYKFSCYAKSNNLATNSGYISILTYTDTTGTDNQTNKISGTNDWVQLTKTFTTGAGDTKALLQFFNAVAGNISDIWFDINSMTLQEVSSLTPTNTIPETMGGIFQAQNSVAVDTTVDYTGAYTNTYALTNAVNEGATHRQTFTPTKTKGYSISIWPVVKGTGNWTVVVHDASNNLISSRTIANASIVEGAFNEWVFPPLFTAGSEYHFHVYSSVADGTLKANTTDDLETGSFIQYCSKLSEGMTVVSNGIETNLMASSKDGLLGGSILDLDSGKWKYDSGNMDTLANAIAFASNVFSASAGSITSGTVLINGWTQNPGIYTNNDATARTLVVKVSTILPIKRARISAGFGRATDNTISISTDNIIYTNIVNGTASENTSQTTEIPEYLIKNATTFYIRFNKSTTSAYAVIKTFSIEADIDTSSIPLPTIYPLAVNQFTVPIKTSTAPARAYYRLNKYVNDNNVMMPAIELTDSSGNPLGYGCVKQDNSQETNPCCKLLSSSTGYTGSGGTGSFDATGCILNDGEYMPITGTNYNFEIDYQLGTGTTSISAITKNIAYLSSNSALADSTLDASLMANFFLAVKQQGLSSAIGDVREDIQEVKGGLTAVNEELDRLNGTMFIQTADKTVGNTDVETSIFDGGLGSLVLPAQSLKVGDMVRMRLMGYVSGTNGDASTIKVKVGASELTTNTSNFPATITGVFVEFLFEFTVRSIGSAGTVIGQGRTMFNASVGFGTSTVRGLQMVSGAVALDTTKDNLIDITYTWGTARVGNTLTITNAIVEIKRQ